MKIGILGSGIVGVTLANGFIKHGYAVLLGTNDKTKYADLKTKTAGKAGIGSFEEAAQFGEILVLAVRGRAAETVIKKVGLEKFKDKLVLDTTNPIADDEPVNGVLKFFTSLDGSLMERLQRAAPSARFVKAFSCIGNAFFVNPDFGGVKPTMFICGNDAKAKEQAVQILTQFGFEPADMGSVEAARAIEPLCILWCIPGFLQNDWNHAFKLLKKG
ncbi:MAG TPA: NAD(P)-binding domain-containing protein [Elusimicrobiota bacterium]|nr:NAD(P)-binding domain-containing protein [Elusimicrobiota bacterium]